MMKNMTRGIPRLWKDGYKQFTGLEEAIMKNCEAATELGDTVRSAFGPNGLSKIIINRIEKVIVTTDAATIISELEVQHPAAKILCLAAGMQQREIGDGANFVIVFASELLKNANELLRTGLHPIDIINGYKLSEKKIQEYIKQMTIYEVLNDDLKKKEKLILGIKASISSKQYGLENILSNLVANACLNSMPKNSLNFNIDNIRTIKILGKDIYDSFVINGMVIETKPKSLNTIIKNTKTAVFTCPLESTQTETKGTVLLHNAKELLNYTLSEEKFIENYIKKLYEMGIGLIICGEKISEMALHYINKYKIVALKLTSKWTIRRLCRTLKSRPIVTLSSITTNDLGYCKEFYTKEIGNEIVSIFSSLKLNQSEVSTIVIRGSTKTILNDIERAIDDGVNMVKSMTKNGKFVPGAGACEIELSRILTNFSKKIPDLKQYSIQKFAKSLEIVPRTLAENSGLNDTEIIAKLYKAHEEGLEEKDDNENEIKIDENNEKKKDIEIKEYKFENKLGNKANIGIDINNGTIKDMTKNGVIDLMATRQMGIKLATQAAITILQVDHIIMKKPAGGPRKPNRGHWDDNDDTW